MEDKVIIYVAGNPDAYPLEYYDEQTESYAGVIPELLNEFSAESRYEIIYYQPSSTDQREDLAKNNQVDVLSGYMLGDRLPEHSDVIQLFSAVHDAQETSYFLCFTEAAPTDFQRDLTAFMENISQERISGILMDTALLPQDNTPLYYTIGALVLSIALLVTVSAVIIRKYKQKLALAQRNLEADDVTGLGNFDYLERYYHQLVNDKTRILYEMVYFHVDTDYLLRISSSEETNDFLRHCALILQEHTSDNDVLAKVSDQGFALLRMSSNIQKYEDWLQPIFDQIHEYPQKYNKSFDVKLTAGIYPLKKEDRDLNSIIFDASLGAELAEREEKDFMICSEHILNKLSEDKILQASIEQAFAKHEFELYIQFYVDADSYEVVGGEALSRWNHPQKGILLPNVFVPMMEKEKMISRLDYYCLNEVCAFLENLVNHGIETFFMSCNFSRDTFSSADFVAQCKKIMDAYQFPRELLIMEITESVTVKNLALIQQNILELKEYGVRIALDDFGEGFTSFYDLQKYPLDGIKLDKSLVDNATTQNGRIILKAMIQVGHELGMTILAEGVETDEQVNALQSMHCDVIQGFRFHYPLPVWEAKQQLIHADIRLKTGN